MNQAGWLNSAIGKGDAGALSRGGGHGVRVYQSSIAVAMYYRGFGDGAQLYRNMLIAACEIVPPWLAILPRGNHICLCDSRGLIDSCIRVLSCLRIGCGGGV